MKCKCGGETVDINPFGKDDPLRSIHACQACGLATNSDGSYIIQDTENMNLKKFSDVFHAASGAETIIYANNFFSKTMLFAKMVDYGCQMWMDGLKQGLLLGVLHDKRREGTADGVDSPDRKQPST